MTINLKNLTYTRLNHITFTRYNDKITKGRIAGRFPQGSDGAPIDQAWQYPMPQGESSLERLSSPDPRSATACFGWVNDAEAASDLRALLADYARALDVAFCRDQVVAQLTRVAGSAGAAGEARFLLVHVGGEPVACLGARALDRDRVELERLFVRPACRRRGHARALIEAVLAGAAGAGFRHAVLHTLARWTAACQLYRDFGFTPIDPYRPVLEPDVLFLGLPLAGWRPGMSCPTSPSA